MESSAGTMASPDATPTSALPDAAAAPTDSARSGPGALPNLIVIGAQKCGTSGLHYYLSLHPEISVSRPKELNFFIAERNWPRGVDWYRSHFDPNAKVRSEASPNYTAYPQHLEVPERMHSVLPDAKLLYMVRDPLDRIAAHWVHNYAKRREKGDLRTTLMHPNTSYLARSHYYAQLQRFLRLYPREQVLVIEQEELRNQRNETLRRVFEFAGVDPGFSHPGFATQRHRTSRKRRGTPITRLLDRVDRRRGTVSARRFRALAGAVFPVGRSIEVPDVRGALPDETLRSLRDDAEKLRDLTGLDLSAWSIWDDLMANDRTPEERDRRRKARAAKSQAIKPEKHEHSHPGGTAAAIGTHLAKFSSFQGVSLLLTNLLHYASLIVVARMLGPGALGSYALLFFLTGLVTQIIHLLSKPGTMMRTFGISDDDADDIEEDDESDDGSSHGPPTRSAWAWRGH